MKPYVKRQKNDAADAEAICGAVTRANILSSRTRAANQHFMGGTIMGKDPGMSVTDSHGITHEVPNVMIAGNTLFPTATGVNPTFTTHAITLRAVDHVLAHWPA